MRNPTYITSGYNDDLLVYYKVGSSGTWTLLQSYTANHENYTRKTINLVNAGTTEYYISFVGVSHNGSGIWIDDVAIEGQ
jgi:exopolyphosphatase/pppGpp-phosphohydrolase